MNLKLLVTILIAITFHNGFAQTTNKPKTSPQTGKILAWDNIYFGMPRDTVESLTERTQGVYDIGEGQFKIYCYYNSAGLLYKISLITVPINEGAYESNLKMWHDDLVQTLKTEFGTPTSNRGYPDFSKLRQGKTELSTIWQLKSKTIEMGIGKNYNTCFVSLFIYKNPNK